VPILLYIPEIFGISIEVYFILLFISIPTYFFWRWIFKKFIQVNRTRRVATWTATILLTPLIYVAVFMIWVISISYYPSNEFDKQKWHKDIDKRYELSEDIIENEILLGKTTDEVKTLLGDDYQQSGPDTWSYYLGFKPQLFGIDPDYLEIEFKDGRVIKVSQHTS
jgi:hypothetical protein